jgi:hypothetical protein
MFPCRSKYPVLTLNFSPHLPDHFLAVCGKNVLVFQILANSIELVVNHALHEDLVVDAAWMERGEEEIGMISSVDQSSVLQVYLPRLMLRAVQRL